MGGAKRSRMVTVLLALTLLAPSVAGVQEAMGTKLHRVSRSTRQLWSLGYVETRRQYGKKFRFELDVDKGRAEWHRLRVTEVARGKPAKVGYLEALPEFYAGELAMVIHGNVKKDVGLKTEREHRGRRFMRVMLAHMIQGAALSKMDWLIVREPTSKALRHYLDLDFKPDPTGADQLFFPLKQKGGPGFPSISLPGPTGDSSRFSYELVKDSPMNPPKPIAGSPRSGQLALPWGH